jgi:hypothetical protein
VQLSDASEQDLAVFRARRLRERIYRLNMISYGVITLFLAGFGWYWWDSRGFTQAPTAGPLVLMAAAAAAYIVVRYCCFAVASCARPCGSSRAGGVTAQKPVTASYCTLDAALRVEAFDAQPPDCRTCRVR